MFTGVEIDPLTPGSSAWLKTISASKISAILGLSPYDSPFSLWCRMTGRIPLEPGNKATERGTYLEPAITRWFSDQHPEFRVKAGVSYAHPWRADWTAAPDAILYPGRKRKPVAILEVKTAFHADEWGEPGTSAIPWPYRVQVAWQLFITGAERCYIAVFVGMEFREYVITAQDVESDLKLIMQHVRRFERHLETDTQPDWDGSDNTYMAVRKLHPKIDPDAKVEAPAELVDALTTHKAAKKTAEENLKRAQSEALALMGTARTLTNPHGETIGIRQARGTGTPFLKLTEPKPALQAAA